MSFTHQRPFVVSVEGNIGSGKSTMLRYFEKMDNNVTVLAEPVTEWCDLNGINLLQKLYEDSKRWSMQFQAYVQLSRLRLLKHPSKKKIKKHVRDKKTDESLENPLRKKFLSQLKKEIPRL